MRSEGALGAGTVAPDLDEAAPVLGLTCRPQPRCRRLHQPPVVPVFKGRAQRKKKGSGHSRSRQKGQAALLFRSAITVMNMGAPGRSARAALFNMRCQALCSVPRILWHTRLPHLASSSSSFQHSRPCSLSISTACARQLSKDVADAMRAAMRRRSRSQRTLAPPEHTRRKQEHEQWKQ